MKRYTVVWVYIANYGGMTVEAETKEDAANMVVGFFSKDFHEKGTTLVFEGEPIHKIVAPNEKYRHDGRLWK